MGQLLMVESWGGSMSTLLLRGIHRRGHEFTFRTGDLDHYLRSASAAGHPLHVTEPLRIPRATITARDAVWVSSTHQRTRGWGEVVTSPRLGITPGSADTGVRVITEFAGCHVVAVEQPVPAGHLDALDAGTIAVSVPVIADGPWHGREGAEGILRRPAGSGIGVTRCGAA